MIQLFGVILRYGIAMFKFVTFFCLSWLIFLALDSCAVQVDSVKKVIITVQLKQISKKINFDSIYYQTHQQLKSVNRKALFNNPNYRSKYAKKDFNSQDKRIITEPFLLNSGMPYVNNQQDALKIAAGLTAVSVPKENSINVRYIYFGLFFLMLGLFSGIAIGKPGFLIATVAAIFLFLSLLLK